MPKLKSALGASDRLMYSSNCTSTIKCLSSRWASTLTSLNEELISRRLPALYDSCSPLPSYLLQTTIADFLPIIPHKITAPTIWGKNKLPIAHHLVYFPPPTRLSSLLPDGTDPLHSPGSPFTRRMWAGGVIRCGHDQNTLIAENTPAYCAERIRNVTIKGQPGEEKAYVQIERHIFQTPKAHIGGDPLDCGFQFPGTDNQSFSEIRNLVFMRDSLAKTHLDRGANTNSVKSSQRLQPPEFSHSLTPTASLLFRFSALTFNAHSIHLDQKYCQEVEGHRNLLVHGPLSLLFMTELLRGHLVNKSKISFSDDASSEISGEKMNMNEHIESIEYRNLAPLYAEEQMRVCGRLKKPFEWDLWIEGRDGRLAVRGLAKTKIYRT